MEQISPFVKQSKPWVIRRTLAEYLHARNMFTLLNEQHEQGKTCPFKDLKNLSDVLYKIKEELYLVFRRVLNPGTREFEKANKYTPNNAEIELINNVAMIFHKVMVARELKYVMEHYAADSEDYLETKKSYDVYWEKVRALFDEGLYLLKIILCDYSDDDLILCYLLSNESYLDESFGFSIIDVLQKCGKVKPIDRAYCQVGEYCIKSGWTDLAKKMLTRALEVNPGNNSARHMVQTLSQRVG
ncbi:MAG TPA: hypothetical protein PKN04_07915 [bacterium]|nr:hypothetical protein [bacterium]HNT65684.1 hypothetical protein [bacterium]HOX84843.1 hypothetical protein [bacterium]HPG44291.1 hypothetical protein [bacterium]HPM96658.1 hypothetical protein [bacterium]